MSSINGVDPIIVSNIKIQTQKSIIFETKKVKDSEDRKDGDKEKRQPETPTQSLIAAVDKLNRLLELNKIPLYFEIINNHEIVTVQLISSDNRDIIAEMLPEKVFRLVTEFSTKGFTVNELI